MSFCVRVGLNVFLRDTRFKVHADTENGRITLSTKEFEDDDHVSRHQDLKTHQTKPSLEPLVPTKLTGFLMCSARSGGC